MKGLGPGPGGCRVERPLSVTYPKIPIQAPALPFSACRVEGCLVRCRLMYRHFKFKITKDHPVDEPNPVWACGGRLGLCGQDPSMKVQKL